MPTSLTELELEARRLQGQGFPQHSLRFLLDHFREHGKMPGYPREAALGKIVEHLKLGECITLIGGFGVGKSTLATLAAWRYFRDTVPLGIYPSGTFRLFTGFYTPSAFLYFSAIRDAAYKQDKGITAAIRAEADRPLIVIDELQIQKGSSDDQMIFDTLIDLRYSAARPTILISNAKPGEFDALIGDRNVSRFTERGFRVICNWGTYRRKP